MSTSIGLLSRPTTRSSNRSQTTISADCTPFTRSVKTARSFATGNHSLLVTRTSGHTGSSSRITAPDVALVQNEWPDLPPIAQMKTAIARDRVSHGISYILPVDKTRISVSSSYRTNLRAMFHEPYLNDHLDYDDDVIKTSAKHHFRPNIPHTRFKREWVHPDSYKLSSDVEKIREQYAKSAPKTGISYRKNMNDANNLKTRTTLIMPMKVELPEEARRLKEQAERILREVREDNDDEFDPEPETKFQQQRRLPRRDSLFGKYYHEFRDMQEDVEETRKEILKEKSKQFKKYEDFENLDLPVKPAMPETMESSYLSKDKNNQVWDWLTRGEEITDHNFFLAICG